MRSLEIRGSSVPSTGSLGLNLLKFVGVLAASFAVAMIPIALVARRRR